MEVSKTVTKIRFALLEKVNQPVQLSLFTDTNTVEKPMSNSSIEDRLKLAYHLQGQEIAYQEKNYEPSN